VRESAEPGGNYVELLLKRPQYPPGTAFVYSNPSAHLVAAVLAAALEQPTPMAFISAESVCG
jgi:CubicO group peptidase (beta-lactamase class C family)